MQRNYSEAFSPSSEVSSQGMQTRASRAQSMAAINQAQYGQLQLQQNLQMNHNSQSMAKVQAKQQQMAQKQQQLAQKQQTIAQNQLFSNQNTQHHQSFNTQQSVLQPPTISSSNTTTALPEHFQAFKGRPVTPPLTWSDWVAPSKFFVMSSVPYLITITI